jgi:hypothetical protein
MRPSFKGERSQNIAPRQMMLECPSFRGEQWILYHTMEMANEPTLSIIPHPIPENQIMHPATYVDRVHLDEAVMGQGGADVGNGAIEQDRSAVEPASICRGKTKHITHGTRLRVAAPRDKRFVIFVGFC